MNWKFGETEVRKQNLTNHVGCMMVFLCDLPDDVLYLVCYFLEMQDVFAFGRTCAMINKISKHPSSMYRLGNHLHGKKAEWLKSFILKSIEMDNKNTTNVHSDTKKKNNNNDSGTDDNYSFLSQFMFAKQLIVNLNVFKTASLSKDSIKEETIEKHLISCFKTFTKLEVLMIANDWSKNNLCLSKLISKNLFAKQKNLSMFVMKECTSTESFVDVNVLNNIIDKNFKHNLKYISFSGVKNIDFQRLHNIVCEYTGIKTIYIGVYELDVGIASDWTYFSTTIADPTIIDPLFYLDSKYYHNNININTNTRTSNNHDNKNNINNTDGNDNVNCVTEMKIDSKNNDFISESIGISIFEQISSWNKYVFSKIENIIIVSHLFSMFYHEYSQRYWFEKYYYLHKNLHSLHLTFAQTLLNIFGSENLVTEKVFNNLIEKDITFLQEHKLKYNNLVLPHLEELCIRVTDKFRLLNVFNHIVKHAPNLKKLFLWVDLVRNNPQPNERDSEESDHGEDSGHGNSSNLVFDDSEEKSGANETFSMTINIANLRQCFDQLIDDNDDDSKSSNDSDNFNSNDNDERKKKKKTRAFLSNLETFYIGLARHGQASKNDLKQDIQFYVDVVCRLTKKYKKLRNTGVIMDAYFESGKKHHDVGHENFDCNDCFAECKPIFDAIYKKKFMLNRLFWKLIVNKSETRENQMADLKKIENAKLVFDKILNSQENKEIYQTVLNFDKCKFDVLEDRWYREGFRWAFDFRFKQVQSEEDLEQECDWICECSVCDVSSITSRGRLNVENPLMG